MADSIYACVSQGGVWQRIGGLGAFVDLGEPNRRHTGMAQGKNGDVYLSSIQDGGTPGDIFKRSHGLGAFVSEGYTVLGGNYGWMGVSIGSDNSIWAVRQDGIVFHNGAPYGTGWVRTIALVNGGAGYTSGTTVHLAGGSNVDHIAINSVNLDGKILAFTHTGLAGGITTGGTYGTVEAGGATFTVSAVSPGPVGSFANGIAVCPITNDVYVSVWGYGIYVSPLGAGAEWNNVADAMNWTQPTVDPTTGDVYCISTGQGLYKRASSSGVFANVNGTNGVGTAMDHDGVLYTCYNAYGIYGFYSGVSGGATLIDSHQIGWQAICADKYGPTINNVYGTILG